MVVALLVELTAFASSPVLHITLHLFNDNPMASPTSVLYWCVSDICNIHGLSNHPVPTPLESFNRPLATE